MTGIVSVITELDREIMPAYYINILAIDQGTSQLRGHGMVKIMFYTATLVIAIV